MTHLFSERIETERLVLERMCRENVDIDELYRLCSHREGIEEETEFLSWDPHSTPKETLEFVTKSEENWDDASDVSYVIRPKAGEDRGGEIAGNCGLHIDWKRRTGTLGIWLRKRFWGRGYSGERADALIEVAFDNLDLELVAVIHGVGNEKSRRAIEKYVERFGGEHDCLLRNWVPMDDEVNDVHRYTITREGWKASREEDEP